MLRADKAGCNERTSPIPTTFDGVTLLGLFIDAGIVSIVVVDWLATGAVHKAAQTDFILTPECSAGFSVSPSQDFVNELVALSANRALQPSMP